jgi:hypothetical protein
MGKGIDLARENAPLHAAVLDDFKDQLLIVLLKRLGGQVSIPITEVDNTGSNTVSFNIRDGAFNFSVEKKQ